MRVLGAVGKVFAFGMLGFAILWALLFLNVLAGELLGFRPVPNVLAALGVAFAVTLLARSPLAPLLAVVALVIYLTYTILASDDGSPVSDVVRQQNLSTAVQLSIALLGGAALGQAFLRLKPLEQRPASPA